MRKNVFGRRFKRDINERKALFKSLMSSLVLNERIKTTEAKAKAIKAEADKLITKARKEKNLAKKLLSAHLTPKAIEKVISQIVPRFEKRQGGYTRIIKMGERLSDGARIAMIEWVEIPVALESVEKTADKKKKVMPAKKTPKKAVKKVPAKKTVKSKRKAVK